MSIEEPSRTIDKNGSRNCLFCYLAGEIQVNHTKVKYKHNTPLSIKQISDGYANYVARTKFNIDKPIITEMSGHFLCKRHWNPFQPVMRKNSSFNNLEDQEKEFYKNLNTQTSLEKISVQEAPQDDNLEASIELERSTQINDSATDDLIINVEDLFAEYDKPPPIVPKHHYKPPHTICDPVPFPRLSTNVINDVPFISVVDEKNDRSSPIIFKH